MNKLFLLIALLIVLVLSVSCNQYVSHEKNLQSDENIVKANGTVIYIELEGGFFGIIADDGSKYKPINLTESFQKDGLKVRFEGKLNTELMGIYMWGKLIEITKIKER